MYINVYLNIIDIVIYFSITDFCSKMNVNYMK